MDLHGIDLNLLVAFDALMVERNVTRAGKRTGRTQPAMSAALARLRALFEDELFVRAPSGLQPTQRAIELAEPLGRALGEIRRTLDFTQRFDPATSTQGFTLALSDHPALVLLPRLTDTLRKIAPGVILRINAYTHRDDAVSLLDAGEADLTIGVPARQGAGGRILTRPLFEDRFVCILRRDHPAASQTLDLDAFLVRTTKRLERAQHRIAMLNEEVAEYYQHFRVTPDLIELRNLLQTAELIVRSALHRHESRGLHYTLDYPQMLPEAVDTVLTP